MIVLAEGLTKRSVKAAAAILRKSGLEFDVQGQSNTFSILLLDHNKRTDALDDLKAGGFFPDFSNNAPVELEYREGITSAPNVRGNQNIFDDRSRYSRLKFRNTAYIIIGLLFAICGLGVFLIEYYLSLSVADQIRIDQLIPSNLWSLKNDLMADYKDIKLFMQLK